MTHRFSLSLYYRHLPTDERMPLCRRRGSSSRAHTDKQLKKHGESVFLPLIAIMLDVTFCHDAP